MTAQIELLKWSLRQISEATGESLPLIHDAINEGHLKTFLVGRRRFARPADVRAWIDFLQAESDAGRPVSYRARNKAGLAA
jgi:hypothetical protein